MEDEIKELKCGCEICGDEVDFCHLHDKGQLLYDTVMKVKSEIIKTKFLENGYSFRELSKFFDHLYSKLKDELFDEYEENTICKEVYISQVLCMGEECYQFATKDFVKNNKSIKAFKIKLIEELNTSGNKAYAKDFKMEERYICKKENCDFKTNNIISM